MTELNSVNASKLRLWVDGQCLQTASRMRGIGRYVLEFLAEIVENHKDIDLHVSLNAAMAKEALTARDCLRRMLPSENIHVWNAAVEGPERIYGYDNRRKLSEIAIAYHVQSLAPDIALSASPFEDFAVPLLPNGALDIPTACIFYDAIPARFPEHYLADFSLRAYYERRLNAHKMFDLVLCISDFAQKELLDILNIGNSVNIGAGVSKSFTRLINRHPDIQRKSNTLLYVGGFDWRKNVSRVIDAIANLTFPLRNDLNFVVVGDIGKAIKAELNDRWNAAGLPEKNLSLVGHVSDEALVYSYQEATAVIQPSLMEGFGLTALEAILCGAPVIASNAGALPEIIVEKQRLFNPTDTEDIARSIRQVFQKNPNHFALSKKEIVHAQSFTWKRTVEIALEALTEKARKQKEKITTASRMLHQEKIVASIKELKLPINLTAGCLARAEQPTEYEARLIVDATSTVISNAGTGIQRVVCKISEHILDDSIQSIHTYIGFSNSDDGWYIIPNGNLALSPSDIKEKGEKLFLGKNDHLLMLDSSWLFHTHHASSLTAARLRGAQVTSCLYDLIPLNASGFTSEGIPPIFSKWLKTALTYSTGFVCISKAVADEFVALLESINFPGPMKVSYWPLGADFSMMRFPTKSVQKTATVSRVSFLMVGTIEPRKGHRVVLDAFDKLWGNGVDIELTIVGKLGWNANHLVERIKAHPEWGNRLRWNSCVSDEQLQIYYQNADCLIAASFAEGFGLPIVEAGHFGKPVIASDIPVFREVSSKSYWSMFFETGNPISLVQTIEAFVQGRSSPKQGTKILQSWESWAQSAAALKEIVLTDKWYHYYKPKTEHHFLDIADTVEVKMPESFFSAAYPHVLSLQDGPISGENDREIVFVIKVENCSDTVWSSTAIEGRNGAITLVAHLYGKNGELLASGFPSSLPYILSPGCVAYMPLKIPSFWGRLPETRILAGLTQRDGTLGENPISIPL